MCSCRTDHTLDTMAESLCTSVTEAWRSSGDFGEQTVARCGESWRRFITRQVRLGRSDPASFTVEECREFVYAFTAAGRPPEVHTMHARRTAVRMGFRALRQLGHDVSDPTLDLTLPPRSATAARPLTDLEVELCRSAARLGEAGGSSLQRATVWALGETTAISSEISAVRIRDVDDPQDPRWVHLSGTRRHDARQGELTDWGVTIIRRQLEQHLQTGAPPSTPLAYRGSAQGGTPKAQASMVNAIGAVLKFAGLADEADVRPASLRNWAGRRLFDDGMPIQDVARRMGSRSLDGAAEDIGLNWRPT
ncbi:hypothetical protein ASF38_00070 [Aeromicrobium sp. Leaf272]|nr:hypothetical protein ASF38_00070 [Aeromicrobium sp. Leaf272]